jgi:hypothetical protein
MEKALIVSSDGHAMALMRDYRPYLPPGLREEFDDFLKLYDERGQGRRTFDQSSLSARCDPEIVEQWMDEVFERLDGNHNSQRRIAELEAEGISARKRWTASPNSRAGQGGNVGSQPLVGRLHLPGSCAFRRARNGGLG